MSKERFDEKLTELLKSNPEFVDSTGEFLRDKVKLQAWDFDHDLIKLPLSKPEIKAKFFQEVDEQRIASLRAGKERKKKIDFVLPTVF